MDVIPKGTQRWNNVNSTLIQRHDVESTLNRRCFNIVCPLGILQSMNRLNKTDPLVSQAADSVAAQSLTFCRKLLSTLLYQPVVGLIVTLPLVVFSCNFTDELPTDPSKAESLLQFFLCVCGFLCDICFVIICSSSHLFVAPRAGSASWLCHFLGIFT